MTEETSPKKHHYWLVAGNVVVATDDENTVAIPTNGMITTDEYAIGEHQLGKAQQSLQVSLFQKLGAPANVVDVIIQNIVPLGHMTKDEFHARPEGLSLQEVAKPTAEVIDFTQATQDLLIQ